MRPSSRWLAQTSSLQIQAWQPIQSLRSAFFAIRAIESSYGPVYEFAVDSARDFPAQKGKDTDVRLSLAVNAETAVLHISLPPEETVKPSSGGPSLAEVMEPLLASEEKLAQLTTTAEGKPHRILDLKVSPNPKYLGSSIMTGGPHSMIYNRSLARHFCAWGGFHDLEPIPYQEEIDDAKHDGVRMRRVCRKFSTFYPVPNSLEIGGKYQKWEDLPPVKSTEDIFGPTSQTDPDGWVNFQRQPIKVRRSPTTTAPPGPNASFLSTPTPTARSAPHPEPSPVTPSIAEVASQVSKLKVAEASRNQVAQQPERLHAAQALHEKHDEFVRAQETAAAKARKVAIQQAELKMVQALILQAKTAGAEAVKARPTKPQPANAEPWIQETGPNPQASPAPTSKATAVSSPTTQAKASPKHPSHAPPTLSQKPAAEIQGKSRPPPPSVEQPSSAPPKEEIPRAEGMLGRIRGLFGW